MRIAVSGPICCHEAPIRVSVRSMAPSPASGAEDKLRRWAEAQARRDEIVCEAAAAGVSIHRIQQITGIARSTILGILVRRPRKPLLRLVSSDEPPPP